MSFILEYKSSLDYLGVRIGLEGLSRASSRGSSRAKSRARIKVHFLKE